MGDVKIKVKELRLSFGDNEVLKGITIDVFMNKITGFMGPAGSGKSTLISCINRMIDFEENVTIGGEVVIDEQNILDGDVDEVVLRRRVGTVYAVPIPLPRSVYENIVYGPRLKGVSDRNELDRIVEESLGKAFLWDEMKNRLHASALKLSGGQQQRLCLARTLALTPEVILLDEPCSGLDPISTAKIEEALNELKKEYTIILVSNNTKQIARITDDTVFLYMGQMIEGGSTDRIFTNPSQRQTEDYIQGKFG
jgi:phosphate transport system ATP-binding protein